MRAAVFDSSFDIKLKDVTSAAPGPGEVEVRAKAAGLCAGDLYIYLGKNPYVTFPASAAMRSRAWSAPSVPASQRLLALVAPRSSSQTSSGSAWLRRENWAPSRCRPAMSPRGRFN